MVYCIHKHNVQEIRFMVLNCCKIFMAVLTADTMGTLHALGSFLDSLNLQSLYLGKYNLLLYEKRLGLKIVIFTAMESKSRSLSWYTCLLCLYKILNLKPCIHILHPALPPRRCLIEKSNSMSGASAVPLVRKMEVG